MWLFGKTSRLFFFEMHRGLQCGLKWWFGSVTGNPTDWAWKGNRWFGDISAALWEILPNLNRKIYPLVLPPLFRFYDFAYEKVILNMTDGDKGSKKIKVRKNNLGNRKISYSWVVTIIIWTFFISCAMQTVQAGLMSRVTLLVACFILFSVVFISCLPRKNNKYF